MATKRTFNDGFFNLFPGIINRKALTMDNGLDAHYVSKWIYLNTLAEENGFRVAQAGTEFKLFRDHVKHPEYVEDASIHTVDSMSSAIHFLHGWSSSRMYLKIEKRGKK